MDTLEASEVKKIEKNAQFPITIDEHFITICSKFSIKTAKNMEKRSLKTQLKKERQEIILRATKLL